MSRYLIVELAGPEIARGRMSLQRALTVGQEESRGRGEEVLVYPLGDDDQLGTRAARIGPDKTMEVFTYLPS